MPDAGGEPGPWELQRSNERLRADVREGFAQLNARLDRLVTADAFLAEQRRVDDKLADLVADIASERESRREGDERNAAATAAGDSENKAALDRMTATQRWMVAAVLLPLAFFIITTLITLGVIG